ncbi:hypothetical protein H0H93_015138 [Arthromyces matolae]|nr:hypothetical protein H0H93_015138 [Arthromyces matolae]
MPPVEGTIYEGKPVPTFVLAIPFEDEDMWRFCEKHEANFVDDLNRHYFALSEARTLLKNVAEVALVYQTPKARRNPMTGVYFATNTCQESLDLAHNLDTVKYIQEVLFTTKPPRWCYVHSVI